MTFLICPKRDQKNPSPNHWVEQEEGIIPEKLLRDLRVDDIKDSIEL
jgi:hypothetical protein